ncbi:LysR family transcriptional regulator [Dongia sp.]|uniref:LysR family transcriptional regulator n=1 Tax=Dongia sp. TaxID=1977262 RepID=UPI0035AFEBEF
MQDLDWNDLRHVLALARSGSFTAAAALLKINGTTVARRLRAIETQLAARLFERDADGVLHPTPSGAIAIARAEAIEAEIGSLTAAIKGADIPAIGHVRLTAVPLLANRLLMPALPALLKKHRGLHLDLIADPRGYDLTRREADIALRLARPENAVGARILARRLATLGYAAYMPAARRGKGTDLPWLSYEEAMAHLPQARWMAEMAPRHGGLAAIAVNDGDALVHAVQAGLGRTLLPRIVGDKVAGIRRIALPGPPPPGRELWLLTHRDLRPLARIAAVTGWLEKLLGGIEPAP